MKYVLTSVFIDNEIKSNKSLKTVMLTLVDKCRDTKLSVTYLYPRG